MNEVAAPSNVLTQIVRDNRGDDLVTNFATITAAVKAYDWAALGRAEAESRTESCGYSDINSDSTPWGDVAGDIGGFFWDEDLSDVQQEYWEEVVEEIADRYNDGYIQAEREQEEAEEDYREQQLAAADAAGWRVCVFGLPGARGHAYELAAPGTANEVSERLFKPGPHGPYDSAILTISQADQCTYQDGTSVYGDAVEEAISSL